MLIEQVSAQGMRVGLISMRGPRTRKGQSIGLDLVLFMTKVHLFSATFANGAVESVVLADQGAGVKILPHAVLKPIQRACPELKMIPFASPQVYNSVESGVKVKCVGKVVADVQLRIRHGTTQLLRVLEWSDMERDAEFVILSRSALDAIGCDNRAMLSAATHKNNFIIDMLTAMVNQGVVNCASVKTSAF